MLYFLASSDIRRCKLLTSCKKMNHSGFNGYNEIDRINFRANVKRFTHKTKKKNNIMSIVRQC